MPDLIAGTYPYRKRHAIMDAVQAGLLPHMPQADGEVTVIVRVVPPSTDDVAPERARGCATKVTESSGGGEYGNQ